MVIWGAVWFGLFSLLAYMVGFDGASNVFVYAIFGAGAGAHLQSVLRTLLKTVEKTVETSKPIEISPYVDDIHHENPSVIPAGTPYNPIESSHSAITVGTLSNDKTNDVVYTDPLFSGKTQAASYSYNQERSVVPNAPYIAPEPAQPSIVEKAFVAAKAWLLGGNTVVRVGIVVLFIGLAFLAKYTAQLGLFPIEARLSIIVLFGIGLLGFGFIKRLQVPQYALTLQGAGVAVLYLTLLAAMKAYNLLPMGMTFALMVVVCALGCALACLQNSLVLALVSFVGGFAAPLLLSTGEGNYIGLFSYYTILNIAILVIASMKIWRPLNLLGFFATFGVATSWGILKFQPENYVPAQIFLALFFIIYLFTAMFYARNTARADTVRQAPLIDSTLIFGTPLVGFGLQVGLVRAFEYGAAFSALAMAAVYVLCAFVLVRQTRGYNKLLLECFLALGVGFLTIAIPLALDGHWIAVVWALEGLAAFWVGMRQARWMPRALGVALQALSALLLLSIYKSSVASATPFLNTMFLNFLLLAVCAVLLAYWLRNDLAHSDSSWARAYVSIERQLATPFYIYALLVLLFSISNQWLTRTNDGAWWIGESSWRIFLCVATFLVIATLSAVQGVRINRIAAYWPNYLVLPVLFLTALILTIDGALLSGMGWFFWTAAFVLNYWLLYRAERRGMMLSALDLNHAAMVWLFAWVVTQTLAWHLIHSSLVDTAWASVIGLVSATLLLIVLSVWAGRNPARGYPLVNHQAAYLLNGALPIAVMVLFGIVGVAIGSSGVTRPLPYFPLLNPTDLSVALGLAALVFWRLKIKQTKITSHLAQWIGQSNFWPALAVLAFVFINTVWLRVAHHFFGVEWNASVLADSSIVQTGYAILWTLIALITMVWAHRKSERTLWMAGAGLLGLTVIKLVFVDLVNRAGFERIIAFIAVGIMMLIIGYLAPLPPHKSKQNQFSKE